MSRTARLSRVEIVLLVLFWAAALMFMFAGHSITTIRHARESVLKRDLETMRVAIENYSQDKRHPPVSLQTLVDEKYLGTLPTNPFTRKADWVPHYVRVESEGGQSAIAIDNVHAGPPYSDW